MTHKTRTSCLRWPSVRQPRAAAARRVPSRSHLRGRPCARSCRRSAQSLRPTVHPRGSHIVADLRDGREARDRPSVMFFCSFENAVADEAHRNAAKQGRPELLQLSLRASTMPQVVAPLLRSPFATHAPPADCFSAYFPRSPCKRSRCRLAAARSAPPLVPRGPRQGANTRHAPLPGRRSNTNRPACRLPVPRCCRLPSYDEPSSQWCEVGLASSCSSAPTRRAVQGRRLRRQLLEIVQQGAARGGIPPGRI